MNKKLLSSSTQSNSYVANSIYFKKPIRIRASQDDMHFCIYIDKPGAISIDASTHLNGYYSYSSNFATNINASPTSCGFKLAALGFTNGFSTTSTYYSFIYISTGANANVKVVSEVELETNDIYYIESEPQSLDVLSISASFNFTFNVSPNSIVKSRSIIIDADESNNIEFTYSAYESKFMGISGGEYLAKVD